MKCLKVQECYCVVSRVECGIFVRKFLLCEGICSYAHVIKSCSIPVDVPVIVHDVLHCIL